MKFKHQRYTLFLMRTSLISGVVVASQERLFSACTGFIVQKLQNGQE